MNLQVSLLVLDLFSFSKVMVTNELERLYGKPYINQDLLDKVMSTRDNTLLHDDSFKVWEKEDLSPGDKRWLSELGRQIENLTKDEFAVITYVAIQNYPEMVFQLMMEEYLNNKEKRNDSNS